ncbi:MAG: hypothetical protein QOD32_2478 [Pyrinomonadaceae bacterium]|jgi:uncharacterized protein (DUF362 family)|nr:hypothetical protein [Pyrinomonadaceae bacterium]
MKDLRNNSCDDARVAVAKTPAPRYPSGDNRAGSSRVDDNGTGVSGADDITRALLQLSRELGWGDSDGGAFGHVIPTGARVLIKPNFVMHANQGAGGIEPLVTHQSLVRAAVEAALQTGAAEVSVGDAPVQGCDFPALLRATGLDEWSADLMRRDSRFRGIRDFRRTIAVFTDGVRAAAENMRDESEFTLFDLGRESLLEPITDESGAFRVTCYDPRLMRRTHAPGRHQYLIARAVLDADVVINLPKLKTHKKAGITCALKNLIGINGNKEFLPHHRLGGARGGGDCYPGASPLKRSLEYVLDRENSTARPALGKVWHGLGVQLERAARIAGDGLGVEGSWSGNDTVWRTALDLNRVLLYGRPDATFSDHPARLVVHVADAVVAGQGDGPLAPEALPMGLLVGSWNAAALDWAGAHLLGYDPTRVSIAREAFGQFRWPLATFAHEAVRLCGDLGEGAADEMFGRASAPLFQVKHPEGWRDAAAQATENNSARARSK